MAKMTFVEFVGAYKDYKKKNGKSARLSEAEFKGLRKEYTSLLNESKRVSSENKRKFSEERNEVKVHSLEEAIKGMSAWKKRNVGTSKLTEAEFNAVKAAYLAEKKTSTPAKKTSKYVETLRAYRKYKIEEMRDNSPITESEKAAIKAQLREDAAIEKIREAKKLVRVAKMKLEEGDMMGAAGAVQGAGDNINAAATPANDPNGANVATPLPQNVVDEIQNIKTSVDALAQEAGIESPVDLGADAAAGVPGAMDTTVPADPNMNGGMMESKDLSATEKRIIERAKRISEGSSCCCGKVPEPPIPQNSTGGNLESNKEEVQPGTVQQLLNGYASGPAAAEIKPAKRWPTKPIKGFADKKLGNIEEGCEKKEDEDKEELKESSWADKHIEEYNKPKFNWNEFLASRK